MAAVRMTTRERTATASSGQPASVTMSGTATSPKASQTANPSGSAIVSTRSRPLSFEGLRAVAAAKAVPATKAET